MMRTLTLNARRNINLADPHSISRHFEKWRRQRKRVFSHLQETPLESPRLQHQVKYITHFYTPLLHYHTITLSYNTITLPYNTITLPYHTITLPLLQTCSSFIRIPVIIFQHHL